MIQTVINRVLWLVGMVLLQTLVLNNINAFGYATPYLYIYVILTMEVESSKNSTMLWAFALGLLIDILSDTPGINAAASVLIAFIRIPILKLYALHESIEQGKPSIKSIGIGAFSKYIATCILLHHTILTLLFYFDLSNMGDIMLRIIMSSALTVLFIIIIDNIRK